MSTEITIANYKLNECEGNLKVLIKNWKGIPKSNQNIIGESHGGVAVSMERGLITSDKLQKAMTSMLENSLQFFETTGIKFSDADNTSASQIQSVN